MAYYHDGYDKARASVEKMDRDRLLRVLDDLFGRDNLPDDYTDADLRTEALRQLREEFTDKTSLEYEQTQFWISVVREQERTRRGLL